MTSRSFRMWVSDFSKNNKGTQTTLSVKPKEKVEDLKQGDKVSTPYGSAMFISFNESTDECTVQMYSDNRSIRLNKAVVRKV